MAEHLKHCAPRLNFLALALALSSLAALLAPLQAAADAPSQQEAQALPEPPAPPEAAPLSVGSSRQAEAPSGEATKVKVWLWIADVYDLSFPAKRITLDAYMSLAYPANSPERIKPLENMEIIESKNVVKTHVELRERGKDGATLKDICRLSAVLKANWDTRKYPFDRHVLTFSLEDYVNSEDFQVYVGDPSSDINPELSLHGWQVSDLSSAPSTRNYVWHDEDEKFSRLGISFVLSRKSTWVIYIKTFLTMFIAIALSFTAFCIKPSDISARFGLPVASIFAVVGNQNIVNQTMPPNSMFTYVDTMHIISYFFILFSVCASAYSLRLCHLGKQEQYVKFDRSLVVILPLVYTLSVVAVTASICWR